MKFDFGIVFIVFYGEKIKAQSNNNLNNCSVFQLSQLIHTLLMCCTAPCKVEDKLLLSSVVLRVQTSVNRLSTAVNW